MTTTTTTTTTTAPVLLVEDNPVSRQVALTLLRKAGYAVVVAGNGLEAVRLAATQPFALILLDMLLPELDGIEAARRIRALPHTAQVPIIAFSATEPGAERSRWQAAGIDDYVAKPVNRQQLLTTLARWLGSTVTVTPLNESILNMLEAETDNTVLTGAVRLFIDDTRVRLTVIDSACQAGDWRRLQREVHTLKSSAALFGAEHLHTLVRQLDRACEAQDWSQVHTLTAALPAAATPVLTALTDRYLTLPKNRS